MSSFYGPSSSASPPPPPPPLPPPSPPQIKYDVFLSFRGEDTRNNFTSHLHKALIERGINAFIDCELIRGNDISPSLLTAIEESRISIIIFSKNYASSRWCLEELTKILECKNRVTNEQRVIPVLYGVTQSDIRNQTGSFADAFAKHEKRFNQNLEAVHGWRHALKEASNLSGLASSSDKSEAELIEEIVETISREPNKGLGDEDNSNNGGGDDDNNGGGGGQNNKNGSDRDGDGDGDKHGCDDGRGEMNSKKMDSSGKAMFGWNFAYHAGSENGYPVGQLQCAQEVQSSEPKCLFDHTITISKFGV